MSFLLDTDHLSAHLRRPAGLVHRFVQHSGRTPTIALAELYVWATPAPVPRPITPFALPGAELHVPRHPAAP